MRKLHGSSKVTSMEMIAFAGAINPHNGKGEEMESQQLVIRLENLMKTV